jgi:hypothetical protein
MQLRSCVWVKMMWVSSPLIRVTDKVASSPRKVKRMVQHKEPAVKICTRCKQRVYAGYRAKYHVTLHEIVWSV